MPRHVTITCPNEDCEEPIELEVQLDPGCPATREEPGEPPSGEIVGSSEVSCQVCGTQLDDDDFDFAIQKAMDEAAEEFDERDVEDYLDAMEDREYWANEGY